MNYELTYIINPELKPEKIALTVKKAIKAVEKIGGKIIESGKKAQKNISENGAEGISGGYFFQEPTRQKLAYPIKHFDFGYYTAVDFALNLENDDDFKNNLESLDNKLKSINNIIRHLIIKKENIKDIPKRRKPKKEAKPAIFAASKAEKDLSAEEAKIKEKTEKGAKEKIVKKEDKIKRSKDEKSKKIKLEDIDEKLDKILTDI